MGKNSNELGRGARGLSRRALLKSSAGLAGGAFAVSIMGAASSRAFAAATKPSSLNMLYATSEADFGRDQSGFTRLQDGDGLRHQSRHDAL